LKIDEAGDGVNVALLYGRRTRERVWSDIVEEEEELLLSDRIDDRDDARAVTDKVDDDPPLLAREELDRNKDVKNIFYSSFLPSFQLPYPFPSNADDVDGRC